jgi:threonine/homoserine/homoserine lactone efflux protein
MRRLLLLVSGSLAAWLVVALPFRFLAEDPAVGQAALVYSGTAVLICLVPTALTLVWGARSLTQSPEQQLVAILGGTGVRLFSVLLAGFALTQLVPYYRASTAFWIWLGAFYLITLSLEMALLLAGRPAAEPKT